MSIFDRIKHAIFREAAAQTPASGQATAPGQATAATPSGTATAAPAAPTPGIAAPTPEAAAAPARQTTEALATGTGGSGQTSGSGQPVDIEPILNAAAKKSGQTLDWRHSIVDLMKALGMDASLEERKELAGELHYTGDVHDSAKMNMFLHKALMKKLSENGGKVPADLLD